MAGKTSEAKIANREGARIIGQQMEGGIITMEDGSLGAIKADNHRYNANWHNTSGQPWGRDGVVLDVDVIRVGYHLELPSPERSVQAAAEWLAQQEAGVMPEKATIGVEVEAVTYQKDSAELAPATGLAWPLDNNTHPELLDHVLETATDRTEQGKYPRTPVEIARAVAQAVNEAQEIAALQDKRIVYTSAPEGGCAGDAHITDIPYLKAFSPNVLQSTLDHAQAIPPEVIDMYRQMGMDIIAYLGETGTLDWPVNALHVHNGVPEIDGLADTRSAYAAAQVRMTEMAKVLSFMLYNTRYCYGADTGVKDVRSIMRRLLSTSHDSTMPESAAEFIHDATEALVKGEIHSLPRHPWSGQHDRVRLRMDGDKHTMESIDGAMTPDLRAVLGWVYANQIMTTLALEALTEVGGDESRVPSYLIERYGPLMRPIPAMGESSSYADDLLFNQRGYDAAVPWQNGQTLRELACQAGSILQDVAARYPALRLQADVVSYLIGMQTARNNGPVSLEEYLGIENGDYQPNGKNIGVLTDVKDGNLERMIAIQADASRLQAESLAGISDEAALRAWFGIN